MLSTTTLDTLLRYMCENVNILSVAYNATDVSGSGRAMCSHIQYILRLTEENTEH